MNWKSLTALKLTKTFRRTVSVYTLNLFRLVIVLKLVKRLRLQTDSVSVRQLHLVGNFLDNQQQMSQQLQTVSVAISTQQRYLSISLSTVV